MLTGLKRWAAPAVIVALAIALNWNVLRNDFVYDDGAQVLNNPYIRGAGDLGKIFGTNVWSFLGRQGISNYYRPLMHLLYMAVYAIFGFSPLGYHILSIAFHVGCSLLVFYLARALFPGVAALPAALLFAAHPIHTEAVAWVASITEVACAFFFLLSFYLYVRGRPAWSAAAALPALLSKETALMLLPLLVIYEYGRRGPPEARRAFLWHLAPLALYVVLRINALGGFVMTVNQFVLPWSTQIYSMVYLAGKYLAKLLVPAPFNIYHVFRPATSPADWRFLGGLLLLAGAAGGAAWLWRRGRPLWFAVAWMLVPLAPVLYISRLGENVFTERYLYLPSAGFCWLLAGLFRGRAVAFALLLLNYGLLTYYRNGDWRDDITLYAVTLQVSPESDMIRSNLGSAFMARRMPDRALPFFAEVARRRPNSPVAQNDVGTVHARMGRREQARESFQRAAVLQPDWAVPWYNLGRVADESGDPAAAEKAYRRALSLDPGQTDARINLGVLLVEQGRLDEAEAEFRAAGSHTALGKLHQRRGQKAEAEAEFRGAIAQDPNAAEAWYLLGILQRESGRAAEAAHSFEQARRVLPWSGWKNPPPELLSGFRYNGGRR